MNEEEMLALDVLETAEVINLFTETAWVCVDRHAWDQYVKSKEIENESQDH